MSNQLASLPWVIDTVSAVALSTIHMYIDHIDYVDYNDPSAVAEIQDKNGRLVALLKGNSDVNVASTYEDVGWVTGLLVPPLLTNGGAANLASGKLIIYLR